MTVHFLPWDKSRNLFEEANHLYEEAATFDCIDAGDLVAVKLHVGELGNPNYVQPCFVHEIARQIKARGGKPFLTDSNTYYLAQRHNAVDHMQTALINGFNLAPFIVADGLKSENFTLIKTKGILNEIEVSGAIAQADAMIVVSHCKGHELSGFGGAIKNLAMGCTPRAGKLRQHRAIGLEIDTSKCVGCGKCKEACAFHIPDIIEGKAYNVSKECMRCPVCIAVCPMKAIRYTGKDNLSKALASAAYGILSTFKPQKVSYINFAKDIAEGCDCLPNPGPDVFKDIGIFASDSPVSIDAAFLNSMDYKTFNETSEVDCMVQVQEAAAIGIAGNVKPKIKTL
ncbi:MAG: DUF362 domain-containing protein [Nitrososphaerota archaeon]|jgi:uncharacterized Fe-S center protein|nr:DUF362 domain-containing protein [Nitrososphaerota archaeon]